MSPLRLALHVFRKEVVETLRDRRTLIVMVVLPLCLYPIMGVGVAQWVGIHETEQLERTIRVGLSGPRWGALERELRRAERVELVEGAGDEQLRSGAVDVTLAVPRGHRRALVAGETVELQLSYDLSRDESVSARQRLRKLLDRLSADIRTDRLHDHGLSESLIRPLRTDERNIATMRSEGVKVVARVVPLIVIMMVLLGAFYPAIDVTAGEKERGTLETLLVTPAPRTAIIAGKYLVVATIATLTGLLNLASLGLTLGLGFGPALQQAGLSSDIPWISIALTGVTVVPVSLFFAAVMIATAGLARSFKEAQNLLTPVYLLTILPAMAAQLPGLELTPTTAVLPVVNVALLTRDIVAGQLALLPAALTLASIAVYTAIAIKLAARVFHSERMLFAPDPGRASKRTRPPVQPGSVPAPAHAFVLLLVVMALIILIGQPAQAHSLIPGILVTEWALVALPVLVLIRVARADRRASLALHPAAPLAYIGALLAGLSAWYIVGSLVELVQQRVLPVPPEVARAFQEAILDPERNLAVDLIALAISPALCEELLFRGVILQTTRRVMSPAGAVLLNGALFGAFHLSVYRFFPTMLLGILLAYLVLRSGSILPSMLFHVLNNSIAIIAGRLAGETVAAPESPISYPLLAAAAALFIIGMAIFVRATSPPATPPPSATP